MATRTGKNSKDLAFEKASAFFAFVVLSLTVLLFLVLLQQSMPALRKFGARFLVSSTWDPVVDQFGALPFLYGTLVSSFLAVLIAVPLSVGAAIFLTEFAPLWLKAPVSFLAELLAAIPSVIYGLWGLFVMVPLLRDYVEPALGKAFGFLPLFQGPPIGLGFLAAGLILAVMILPTIASVTIEVLKTVPQPLKEAALALGATRWESIRMAVLPYSRAGIAGATLLGLGRALGETMAVTMVIGNTNRISASLLAPGSTMASVIANEFTEATSTLYLAALCEIALVLFAITLVLNAAARLLIYWATGGRHSAPR